MTETGGEKDVFGAAEFLFNVTTKRKKQTPPPKKNVFWQYKISTIRVDSTPIVFHSCSANRPNPGKCSAKSLVHLPSGCTQGQETQYFQTRCTTAGQLQRDSRGVCGSLVSVPCHSEGYTCHGDRSSVYGVGFTASKAVCCPVVRPSPLDHKNIYWKTHIGSQTNRKYWDMSICPDCLSIFLSLCSMK